MIDSYSVEKFTILKGVLQSVVFRISTEIEPMLCASTTM